nr:hypothetical protein [Acetobacter ascendens]
MTDPTSCKAAADVLMVQFGRIDVMANNAGLMSLFNVDSLESTLLSVIQCFVSAHLTTVIVARSITP